MNYVTIVIPTRNRYAKLMRALKSIPDKKWISVCIICDGDAETRTRLLQDQQPNWWVIATSHRRGAVYCRNMAIADTKMCPDGILYATDDIEFHKGSIENALRQFNERFPDDDGVIGFMQEPGTFHPTGVALVGKAFIDRYPNRQLFNPEYHHFACQEIQWLADSLGKFFQAPDAVIRHYHPDKFRAEMDDTHDEARLTKNADMRLIKERKAAGLIWGAA